MSEKQKKPGAPSEQDLIKSALATDLDESTVDIFGQDLFSESSPNKEPPVEKKPAESELKPEVVEEIKLSSSGHHAVSAPVAEEEAPAWERPVEEKPKPVATPAPKAPPIEKPAPAAEVPVNTEFKLEAGEMAAVTAVKEEDKIDQTGEILLQLEKMGDDFLSAAEMKKLFSNVNLMIDLINKALRRLDQLERKLKDKGIF